jgi:hypothetical protein
MLHVVSCSIQAVTPYLTGDILQFVLRLSYSFALSADVDVRSVWSLIKHRVFLSTFTLIDTCDM